jgi:hypothetical protein
MRENVTRIPRHSVVSWISPFRAKLPLKAWVNEQKGRNPTMDFEKTMQLSDAQLVTEQNLNALIATLERHIANHN